MKVVVLGGGPGGLYFALLAKKARPDFDIAVYEQNRADDTFGFGVVFSDETLDEFLSADPASYDAIRSRFTYWSDIVVSRAGEKTVIGGNGFAGCSRQVLLALLQARCREVGVALHFERHVNPEKLESEFPDADLIVAADGINSGVRAANARAFGESVTLHRNKFAWLGSTRPLDAFTFFFRQNEHGHFCAHTYQYEEGRSTWVMECTPEAWAAAGFARMTEAQSARYLEALFAEELEGHALLTNRSLWRNFPRVQCARWSAGRVVLLGDAKASAHWSIGSGTKLAMECAMALARALTEHEGDTRAVFEAYESARRTPVEIIQHNADVSLQWFEALPRHAALPRYAFCFSLMSRAKSLTWDNIELRDANFLARVEDEFYARTKRETGRDFSASRPTPMFTPLTLGELELDNRVVVSPMAQYSARAGVPGDWHFVHYASHALGGAGLLFSEMTCPAPDARITDCCTGLWNDAQEKAWARIVRFVHEHSRAKFCMQLGHAGRKGSTLLPWEGADDHPKAQDNWPLVSASAIPYLENVSQTPAELDRAGMERIRDEFVAATERAARANFDMLELHCAHGYLLASFLSPLTNRRRDAFGGSVERRLAFPLEVFRAVRAVWPRARPMSVRLSAHDWADGGLSENDLRAIARAFHEAGAALIDVSSGQTVPQQTPVYGRMWQARFAEFVRNEVGARTMAVGGITLAAQVNTLVAAARADLVALARPHLNHPNFARAAAAHYGVHPPGWPPQYASAEQQLFRDAETERERAQETARNLRPARRHYTRASEARAKATAVTPATMRSATTRDASSSASAEAAAAADGDHAVNNNATLRRANATKETS